MKMTMMNAYDYALYINNLEYDNDSADWFEDLRSALDAAFEAAEADPDAQVEIMAFHPGSDCAWSDTIVVTEAGAWSNDWSAREAMKFIQ